MRVVCLGASKVSGSGPRLAELPYPEQLALMLGSGWEVMNWAFDSACVMDWEGYPTFLGTPNLDVALAFNPHVVIIELGSNDSRLSLMHKERLPQYKEEFMARFAGLIDSFASLETRPRIWICSPFAMGGPVGYDLTDQILEEDLVPLIVQVTRQEKVGLIDLYRVTVDRPGLHQPDNTHPNVAGAEVYAQTVYRA